MGELKGRGLIISPALVRCISFLFHVSRANHSYPSIPGWSQETDIISFSHELYIFTTMTSLWARWRLKSPASRLFTQLFIQSKTKENIKALRNWPLCGKFTYRLDLAIVLKLTTHTFASYPIQLEGTCVLITTHDRLTRLYLTYMYVIRCVRASPCYLHISTNFNKSVL